MGARLGGNNDEAISEINIVPFVDIILVVLIIFMVTTPIIMKPSINVNLPQAGSGDETTPSDFSVSIDPSGKISLNGKDSNEEGLSQYAKEVLLKHPDIQAIIAADKEVPHGRVIGVIDSIKAAGVKRFAITIDKKK
ncbi:MAG: biopolymer transporter ExbD [Bdellovibrionales bacterium]|nr:biopolymer transporter ExbD [Bdellovibrionales bacterium]